VTVISFFVSVPVLSAQMTWVAPRVSTALIFLTSTFCFASVDAADASAVFSSAGSPWGMSAHDEKLDVPDF